MMHGQQNVKLTGQYCVQLYLPPPPTPCAFTTCFNFKKRELCRTTIGRISER